jgi:hypothetical protein
MRRSVFSGKEAAMDIISEVFDMAAEIVELIVTELLRRKKEKRTRQNKENERSRKRRCTTK